MSRLSDTAAIAAKPLKSPSACPDGGRAITTRMAMPGALQYSYDAESNDMVCCPRAEPGPGGEGLRSAVMTLNGGRPPTRR